MRFCATPELFVSPVPLMVRAAEGIAVIVKGLAPGLKAIALSSVLAENEKRGDPTLVEVAEHFVHLQ